jgi:hypothetical protein
MTRRNSLIRLADNPYAEEDEMGMPSPGDLGGEEEEDPMDDLDMGGMDPMAKGRRLHGPRVKLSLEDVGSMVQRLYKSSAQQTEILASLASSMGIIGKAISARLEKDDEDDKDDKEDKAVRKARVGKQFESDTAVGGAVSEAAERGRADDETMNDPGLQDPAGATEMKGKVAKDDAAGNFGEKDDDIPGNRSLSPDDKDKDAGEILIQGDASDGPGAQVNAAFDVIFDNYMLRKGLIRKSAGPMIGVGGAPPAPDMDELNKRARGMSFQDLNRLRVQVGELSGGLI